MEETSLRTNLAPESLTRSFSVEVSATRKLRAFLHSFLSPLCFFLGFSEVPHRPRPGAIQPEKRDVWEQQLSSRRFRVGDEDGDKNVLAPRVPVLFFQEGCRGRSVTSPVTPEPDEPGSLFSP